MRALGLLRGRRRGRRGEQVAGGRDAGRHRGVVAGHVGVHDRQHQVDVRRRVVVAVDRSLLAGGRREVVGARAEVDGAGQGRVVDILRVALAVAVGVDAHDGPGRGDELHRADRPVEHLVAVELTGVGVGDQTGARLAVEGQTVDAGRGDAVRVEHVAAEAAVVGLDASDGRDQLPRQVARGVGGVDDRLGALVGSERPGRDGRAGGGGDDGGDVGAEQSAGDAGGELVGRRDRRRLLDRLGRHRRAVAERGRRGRLGRGDRGPGARRHETGGPGCREQAQRHERGGTLDVAGAVSSHRSSPQRIPVCCPCSLKHM
ncbi:unannotated protein [freshwater metagenome]|uniref:Unannotated protein n=1 Tax=freshwater metagenome TaxID=449393 RepID=A0A6J6RE62_9ZZZZ